MASQMCFGEFNALSKPKNFNLKIRLCPVTQENILKFKNDLQILDWSIINDLPDVNNMYTSFIYMVQNLYDKSFPIKM